MAWMTGGAVAGACRQGRFFKTSILTGPSSPEGSRLSVFLKNLNETTVRRPFEGRGEPADSHCGMLFMKRPTSGLPGA